MALGNAAEQAVKAPQHYDKVFKDECVYTFTTPFSEAGLYVNLSTWQAVSPAFLAFDAERTGASLYLLQKFTKVPKEKSGEPVTKLAIGVAGGFGTDDFEVKKEYFLHQRDKGDTPDAPYPFAVDAAFPAQLGVAIEAVINHAGSRVQEAVTWDAQQELKASKYAADLVQIPATRKISPNPKDWKCEKSGATENLWLNLSDGYIGGGRKHWDGTGGSNGALDHYLEEKKKGNVYPLVVKLGTITAAGADVYSYAEDEDDAVLDPFLKDHLSHWAIDIMKLEKTEKTVAEIEVSLNMSYDWSRICESGEQLEPLSGPGFVGLQNLGNTCYMNSIFQMLLALDEIRSRYEDTDASLRMSACANAPTDLVAQLAKLCNAALHPPPGSEEGLSPQMLRSVVVKGHPEFSTNRQQDAAEFFIYFVDKMVRQESAQSSRLCKGQALKPAFAFTLEERYENAKKEVVYQQRPDNVILSIPLTKDDCINEPEAPDAKKIKTEEGVPDEPMFKIPFDVSLRRCFAPESMDSFRGAPCTKTNRMATMPKYLFVQLQRYYADENWVPTKLSCSCPMPDVIDLEEWRAKGKQPHEVEMAADSAPPFEPDVALLAALKTMGFSHHGCVKACKATKNGPVEQAMEYVIQHMEDAGFNEPEKDEEDAGGGGAPVNDETVAMLTSLGFSDAHVKKALKATGQNAERAADWLFSHPEGEGAEEATNGVHTANEDVTGKYVLKGFVSHIGKNTSSGHYVYHMKDAEGKWVIFNDSKVARSHDPPLDLGYLYLYCRR